MTDFYIRIFHTVVMGLGTFWIIADLLLNSFMEALLNWKNPKKKTK